mmetsp:Transcript_4711/g.4150  ORF Transcript_4711/g.4150 Transcript_4711/m.4150 type:complete len:102 (+) Transcript_4711:367-672(+)
MAQVCIPPACTLVIKALANALGRSACPFPLLPQHTTARLWYQHVCYYPAVMNPVAPLNGGTVVWSVALDPQHSRLVVPVTKLQTWCIPAVVKVRDAWDEAG